MFFSSLPNWLTAVFTGVGLYLATKHFNKQPIKKASIMYDCSKKGNQSKCYNFWLVNDGNVNITVRWMGLRYSDLGKTQDHQFVHKESDDTKWHTLAPGEASEPISVSVTFITQTINRWMEAGDTQYIDVMYEDAHHNTMEKYRIPITITMKEDNSGLPKAENNGIPYFKHPTDEGVSDGDNEKRKMKPVSTD